MDRNFDEYIGSHLRVGANRPQTTIEGKTAEVGKATEWKPPVADWSVYEAVRALYGPQRPVGPNMLQVVWYDAALQQKCTMQVGFGTFRVHSTGDSLLSLVLSDGTAWHFKVERGMCEIERAFTTGAVNYVEARMPGDTREVKGEGVLVLKRFDDPRKTEVKKAGDHGAGKEVKRAQAGR